MRVDTVKQAEPIANQMMLGDEMYKISAGGNTDGNSSGNTDGGSSSNANSTGIGTLIATVDRAQKIKASSSGSKTSGEHQNLSGGSGEYMSLVDQGADSPKKSPSLSDSLGLSGAARKRRGMSHSDHTLNDSDIKATSATNKNTKSTDIDQNNFTTAPQISSAALVSCVSSFVDASRVSATRNKLNANTRDVFSPGFQFNGNMNTPASSESAFERLLRLSCPQIYSILVRERALYMRQEVVAIQKLRKPRTMMVLVNEIVGEECLGLLREVELAEKARKEVQGEIMMLEDEMKGEQGRMGTDNISAANESENVTTSAEINHSDQKSQRTPTGSLASYAEAIQSGGGTAAGQDLIGKRIEEHEKKTKNHLSALESLPLTNSLLGAHSSFEGGHGGPDFHTSNGTTSGRAHNNSSVSSKPPKLSFSLLSAIAETRQHAGAQDPQVAPRDAPGTTQAVQAIATSPKRTQLLQCHLHLLSAQEHLDSLFTKTQVLLSKSPPPVWPLLLFQYVALPLGVASYFSWKLGSAVVANCRKLMGGETQE